MSPEDELLERVPPRLRPRLDRAFHHFWVAERGRPPIAEDADLFRRAREYFLCGAAERLDAPVGDTYLAYDVPDLLPAALFAGHTWRVREEDP